MQLLPGLGEPLLLQPVIPYVRGLWGHLSISWLTVPAKPSLLAFLHDKEPGLCTPAHLLVRYHWGNFITPLWNKRVTLLNLAQIPIPAKL